MLLNLNQHYSTNPCNVIIHVTPCTKAEVLQIILEIDNNNNKVSEPNSIVFKILETVTHFKANSLCRIFSLSFDTGVFPKCLKVAKVTGALNWVAQTGLFHCFLILTE